MVKLKIVVDQTGQVIKPGKLVVKKLYMVSGTTEKNF